MFSFPPRPSSEARKSKRVMKVPKGTSDYQATWIVDEEDENGEEDEVSTDDEEDDDAMMAESIDGEDLDSQVVSSEYKPQPGKLKSLHRRILMYVFFQHIQH